MVHMSVATRMGGKTGKGVSSGEFSVVIMGDFSGRASRGLAQPPGRLVAVDRDNFFELFSAFDIQLKLPFDEQLIEFKDFDQLHPDYLLDQLAIFAKFRQWQRKAQKPELFNGLLEELRAANIWQDAAAPAPTSSNPASSSTTAASADNSVDFLLEQVLNQGVQRDAQNDVEKLIARIVAPYATLKADVRLAQVQSAIDAAMAQTLRSILHHGDFHNLEATWRSLYFLVRRISSDNSIKLWLLDISQAELTAATAGAATNCPLYDVLVKPRQAASAVPHQLLINLFTTQATAEAVATMGTLAEMAQQINAVCVGAAAPAFAGCSDLIANSDPQNWQLPDEEFLHAWSQLRTSPAAAHLALTAPRFLLRSPYGKSSSPIETFDFTEIGPQQNHQHYLWGNSAVLVAVVLAELWVAGDGTLNTAAASQIDQLPIHVEKSAEGEKLIPSAEIVILDSTVAALRAAGLLVVRSIYNKNAVLIPQLTSCAADGALIFGA